MSGVTGHRVAFDVTMARTNMMGTGAYTRNLIDALHPLMGERLSAIGCGFARPFTHQKTARDRLSTLAHDIWWTQVGTVGAARASEAELLHVPSMLAPVRGSMRLVVTIHDLAIVRFPQKFRMWHRTWTSLLLPRVIRKADAVVAVSHATKNDLIELLGVAPERITVIPCGINGEFSASRGAEFKLQAVRERYGLPHEFLITVGAIEPRKNLVRLLKAVKLLADSDVRFRNLTLVHAGPIGWHADDVPRTIGELRLEQQVRFLGYVPNGDLAALYQLARASVYPSLFEGFGLPVLEAMASGCPVVTSDCSSLPEVAGDAAVLVDPTSVEAIAEGIKSVWDNDGLRRCLIDRGRRRATRFTWDAAARATVQLYDSVLASA